ncbi:neuropeptide receptor 15-like [Lineus longissimus]|uniref:neuropeptide receptor 15-like n=1 Tax=Lineus longissimus TaxID=88925 RepID=UPI002B4D7995
MPVIHQTDLGKPSAIEAMEASDNCTGNQSSCPDHGIEMDDVHMIEIVVLSVLFIIIGVVGLVGNILVVVAILGDKKMRSSATNLFITNLAFADLMLMVFTIPEILMFLINKGWLLGVPMCKIERFILVFSVYGSVLTLVSVCGERYVAIVHPIKAHIFCSRRRIVWAITVIWPFSWLCALPVPIFNLVSRPKPNYPMEFCTIRFPGNHIQYLIPWKYTESVLYYFIPMFVQIFFYTFICKRLFHGTGELHRKQLVTDESTGVKKERTADALKARKSVVKMLIASVIIYFISYSPHQVLLIYNTFAPSPFHQKWIMYVFVTMMTFINSAANPILYCIFSQNFRKKFYGILCRRQLGNRQAFYSRGRSNMHSTVVSECGSTTRHYRLQLKNSATTGI